MNGRGESAFIMKKQFKIGIMLCFLSMALVCILVGQAIATPALQLYIPGSVYLGPEATIAGVNVTESWFTFDNPFTLVVAGSMQQKTDILIQDVMLWIAVQGDDFHDNQDGKITVSEHPDYYIEPDSFDPEIAGVGQPDAVSQPHGVYNDSTHYWGYHLPDLIISKPDPDLVYNYDEDYTPQNPGDAKKGDLQYYQIEYENFFWVHMDLTGTVLGKKDQETFAPFSHDADAPNPIPEPGTLILLGFGLIGVVVFSRKMNFL